MKGSEPTGPHDCVAMANGWCELCKVQTKDWPGLCHQPGPYDITPDEAMAHLSIEAPCGR
jgi:hypothetical protein